MDRQTGPALAELPPGRMEDAARSIHSSRRIPELDGLRGLAIGLVLIWHYLCHPLDPEIGAAAPFLRRSLSLTWSGVDLFFVLSGFLIGGILLDHRGAPRYFQAFYARRATRIFPLYFGWLLVAFTVLAVVPRFAAGPLPSWLFTEPVPAWCYAIFGQNFAMAMIDDFGSPWLGVTWSLAIEEQFYLLLPLLIRFLPARRLPVYLGSLALMAPVSLAALGHEGGLEGYVTTPSRLDGLMLGVLLAWFLRRDDGLRWVRTHRLHLYGILTVFLAGAFWMSFVRELPANLYPYRYSWLALLYGSLLLLAVTEERGPVAALTRNRALRWLGGLAYGVYLLHQPVQYVLHWLIRDQKAHLLVPADFAVTLAALAVTLGMAVVSWRWFEKPILTIGQSVSYDEPAAPPLRRAA
jgi:peptidoglycan/LPS O-acetylase OafA/YrhL